MIRSDAEFRDALRRVEAERESLVKHEAKLRAMGLSEEQVLAGMAPLRTFHMQFAEEVEQYLRVKHTDFGCFDSLHDLGRILIGARIANNLSGRALAKKLGVDESQVSRDERNEYSGITIERACDILDALGVEVKVECKLRQVSLEIEEDYPLEHTPRGRYDNIEFHPSSGAHARPTSKPPRAAA